MPEPYAPKRGTYPLSRLVDNLQLVRVSCSYCKRSHVYYPADLIQIFGDVDCDSLMVRMSCEGCDNGSINVKGFVASGREAVGLKIRRLVAIKVRRVPIWRED